MTLQFMRASILLIFLLGTVGTSIELLLLGHTEEPAQFIPLVLLGVSLLLLLWTAIARSRAPVRLFRACMILFVLAGFVGVLLHFRANVFAELEAAPGLSGLLLYWKAVTGPHPALAPGAISLLGFIGWIWTFRHPILLGERTYSADVKPEGSGQK